MKVNFLILIICTLLSIQLKAQSSNVTYNNYVIKSLVITDKIDDDAHARQISLDKVFITFTVNTDCNVENFRISRPGVLKSLTAEVEKQSKKIIEEGKTKIKIDCNQELNTEFTIPITICFSE